MGDQLTQDQQAIVAAVGLASDQLQAVCSAVATQQHLGFICDATQQQPIVGVRYTKPSNGDTYDLCQAAFDKLPPEEQEQFVAVPTPDINFLIRNVAATEEAVLGLARSSNSWTAMNLLKRQSKKGATALRSERADVLMIVFQGEFGWVIPENRRTPCDQPTHPRLAFKQVKPVFALVIDGISHR